MPPIAHESWHFRAQVLAPELHHGPNMSQPFRCIILGAAGRDFHDFQTFFASRPDFRVVAFTCLLYTSCRS